MRVKHKERVDENADILGLVAANAAAALSGAFVVNGSPTQTAMAEGAGARSQVAQLVFAAVVLVVLLFLTGPLQYLPRCVLASIVFTIAVGMIDVRGPARHPARKPGRVSSGAVHRRRGAGDRRRAGHPAGDRGLAHPPRPPQLPAAHDGARPGCAGALGASPLGPETDPGLIVYRFGADLFYANADRFADEVRALVADAPTPVRWFVIDCAAVFDIDYTAARTVRDLFDELTRREGRRRARARQRLSALGSRTARRHRGGRGSADLRDASRGDRRGSPGGASAGADESAIGRSHVSGDVRRRSGSNDFASRSHDDHIAGE